MKRCLAALLCLLYLSVSTVFAAPHHHSQDEGADCQACTWQKTANFDLPKAVALSKVEVVREILFSEPLCGVEAEFIGIEQTRGPPILPL